MCASSGHVRSSRFDLRSDPSCGAAAGRAAGADGAPVSVQRGTDAPSAHPQCVGRVKRAPAGAGRPDRACPSARTLKKGPNIASIDPESKLVLQLYHPRRHAWREHFVTESTGVINGLTAEGRATVQLLDMNDEDRARLRAFLLRRGRHP
jgi:hypothetical protein